MQHSQTLNERWKDVAQWMVFLVLVFAVKLMILLIDPLPMFIMGDSHSYIATSLTGWIPPDRSFTYGYFIKLTALAAHSLDSLILTQVLISGLNAIILAYILNRFFSLQPLLSFCFGILCSIEPLQLLYERYVMTESLSLFLFVLYLLFVFFYIEKPRLLLLLAIAVLGTAVISVRLSFLLNILVNAFLLPLIAVPSLCRSLSLHCESLKVYFITVLTQRKVFFNLFLHIVISLGLTFVFHSAYKHLNGYLSGKPPAYQYHSAFFLITSFAPIIERADFPDREIADNVFNNLTYDLKNYQMRRVHHWDQGGLVDVLTRIVPDSLEANRIAKDTVGNALLRNPFGLFEIISRGFLDYWDMNFFRICVKSDMDDRELPDYMLIKLRNFSLYADDLPFLRTFTNKYYLYAWPWYLFLLCLPFFALILLWTRNRDVRKYILIVFIASAVIVGVACTLIERPTIRYLHPLGWLSFLVIGTFIHQIQKRLNPKGGNT